MKKPRQQTGRQTDLKQYAHDNYDMCAFKITSCWQLEQNYFVTDIVCESCKVFKFITPFFDMVLLIRNASDMVLHITIL